MRLAAGPGAAARARTSAPRSSAGRATATVTSPTAAPLGGAPVSTAPRATFPCALLTTVSGTTCLTRPALPADVNLLLQDLPHRLHGFGLGF